MFEPFDGMAHTPFTRTPPRGALHLDSSHRDL